MDENVDSHLMYCRHMLNLRLAMILKQLAYGCPLNLPPTSDWPQNDGDGGSVGKRQILPIYRRREMWNLTNTATMADPTTAASIIKA